MAGTMMTPLLFVASLVIALKVCREWSGLKQETCVGTCVCHVWTYCRWSVMNRMNCSSLLVNQVQSTLEVKGLKGTNSPHVSRYTTENRAAN